MDERPIYQELMNYKGWPVIATNDGVLLSKDMIAYCSREVIVIRTEAIDTLRKSPHYKRYLETILDHELKYGPYHPDSSHGPRTDEEREVDNFFIESWYLSSHDEPAQNNNSPDD